MPGMRVPSPSNVMCEDQGTARSMESLNVGVAGGILMFVLSLGMPQLMNRLGALLAPKPTSEDKDEDIL
jgi:hypothetical protein